MSFLIGGLDLEMIVVIVVFLIVLVSFMRDFKITSARSWLMLGGLTAVGGLLAFQWWRKGKILDQLAEREKRLKDLEERYTKARADNEISKAAYEKAIQVLDAEKLAHALAIAQADEELAAKVKAINEKYKPDMTVDESVNEIRKALQQH